MLEKKAIENERVIQKVDKLLWKLDINYKNISLYILSFIHRSIVNERQDFAPEHNERLEFLWDAVLELVITEELFREFPKKSEWELTDIRSALVRGTNLSKVARDLWFSEYLLLGNGEEKSGGRENDYLLANTVESFIWALYLDIWYTVAKDFILRYVYAYLPKILEENSVKDYKTTIQEYAQAELDITPSYRLLKDEWRDHEKVFTVWIYFWDKQKWIWTWSSKKKAQEDAAKNAYLQLNLS